jgi:hypothetical protein
VVIIRSYAPRQATIFPRQQQWYKHRIEKDHVCQIKVDGGKLLGDRKVRWHHGVFCDKCVGRKGETRVMAVNKPIDSDLQ